MIVRLTETAISSLKGHPALIGLVFMNMLFIGAALWFLSSLAESASKNREQLMRDNAAHFELLMRLCAPRYERDERDERDGRRGGGDYRLQSDDAAPAPEVPEELKSQQK